MVESELEASPFTVDRFDSASILGNLEKLVKICEATSWSANYEDIYQRIALALAVNLDCDYANIYLLDVGGDAMTTYASHSLRENYQTIDKKEVTSKPTMLGRLHRMLETKEPILMDYTNPHPCDQIPESAFEQGFMAAITVPLIATDNVLGIFNLCYRFEKQWSVNELTYLKAIGRILGVSIQRAQMSRKEVEIQILNERKFLSSEIHDNLAQSVSSLKIGAESAMMSLDRGEIDSLRENLERLEVIGLQAVKLLREEMVNLRMPQSETLGLIPSVTEVLSNFQHRWAIEAVLVIEGDSEPAVTVQTELQVMRILHESLSNVLRHAKATRVMVEMKQEGRSLYLRIKDNGDGFLIDSVPAERLGIRIMKERAESVGGTFTLESMPGYGTAIKLKVPSII